ncbi:serine/threonine-protein kinase [Kitasatospora cinereorecta]|uniref:non-specific serine/threonine protein kinase n=1 Tax=Kitasatospora cinereorecta TaxID=285560 RepID=A0ABW0VA68_9ACTN
MAEACAQPDCTGTIDPDGFCDECGLAPEPAAAGPVAGGGAGGGPGGGLGGPGDRCARDCTGTIDPDGFCDECGLEPAASGGAPQVPAPRLSSPGSSRSASVRTMSGRSRSHRSSRTGSGRSVSVLSSRGSTGTARRGNLGAGLVSVPPVAALDPSTAVLENAEVPEHKRYCSKCTTEVGRERGGRPGRPEGFCTKCGTAYSFTPKLRRGDLVGGQYEVMGCLAHGGMGWIYLAIDRRVNDKWVVLKGLLDTGDEDALAAAVAERRFLAEVDHPNIVRIINFAEHPDARTGSTDGYIVMEYVGGKSLKDIANERRTPDGRRDPLPVEQALAYALEALPALGYLHSRGLVYCDFKIDNVIQSEDSLKIIDMGAVRRLDDDGPIFGTHGYQAPEIATDGPSAASDLYTVARTLAVLTFDFQGYSTTYRHELPGPEQVELFARYESYYRLLVRATDPDPARRFSSAEEMADQLTGVLREVLALQDGRPRPAPSTLFGPELRVFDTELATGPIDPAAAALALPVPRTDPADPNAGFLAALFAGDPADALTALAAALGDSAELGLRRLRAHLELGDHDRAGQELGKLESEHADDWRVVWYRGLAALAAGRAQAAAESFDAIYDAFPGEPAPKLALALCAELLDNHEDATEFHRLVATTDRSYVSAAFGLARVRLAAGDRPGAVAALELVPEASTHFTAARIGAVRARLRGRAAEEPLGPELSRCSEQLATLTLDARRREELAVEVLDSALGWVLAGMPGEGGAGGAAGATGATGAAGSGTAAKPSSGATSGAAATPGSTATSGSTEPSGSAVAEASTGKGPAGRPATRTVLGHPATERELRLALEHSYRVLARLSDRAESRIEMVERANRARPRTWV